HRTGACRIGEAAPFEKPQEGAYAGKPSSQRGRAGACRPAEGEKGAQVGGAKIADLGEPGRPAAVARHELQELARVALIRLYRVCGEPALARERRQPFGTGGLEVRLGGDEKFLHARLFYPRILASAGYRRVNAASPGGLQRASCAARSRPLPPKSTG